MKKFKKNKIIVGIIKELIYRQDNEGKEYKGFTAKGNRELNKNDDKRG